MKSLKIIIMAALVWGAHLTHAFAATSAFSATGFAQSYNKDYWNLGFQFNVSKNMYATALGTLSAGLSGAPLSKAVYVGLWNSSEQLMTQVTMAGGSFVDGLFTFMPITPVSLLAGQNYYVASVGFNNFEWNPVNGALASGITYIQDAYADEDTMLMFPDKTLATTPFAGTQYFGGNLQVRAVPEPDTDSMLVAGLVLVGILVKRRKCAQVQV